MAYELDEQKKVGLGLIGFGIFFTFLAIILFFDRGLLALGNILLLAGVALLLGWRSTLQLFKVNYKVAWFPYLVVTTLGLSYFLKQTPKLLPESREGKK